MYSGKSVLDAAGGVHVAGLVEAVALAGVEVVHAMGRRGVDGAGALVGRDVIRQHAEDGAVEKRMLEGGALQLRAFESVRSPQQTRDCRPRFTAVGQKPAATM